MSPVEKKKLLQTFEFFQGVSDDDFAALAPMCREVDFPARATIFEEFEQATDVYFILEGKVSLATCTAVESDEISVLSKGDLLGWSPLIGRSRLFDTARTLTPVKAVAFDGKKLLRFCQDRPLFGFEFMRRVATVLAERLSATRRQLAEAHGVHVPEFSVDTD